MADKLKTCIYDLLECPPIQHRVPFGSPVPVPKEPGTAWCTRHYQDPPRIGDRVHVNFNLLGTGIVVGYFIEHDHVGLKLKLECPPEWHTKQHQGTDHEGYALVFGAEVQPVTNANLGIQAMNALRAADRLHDDEEGHIHADQALCVLLFQLGFTDVVKQFMKIKKFYA